MRGEMGVLSTEITRRNFFSEKKEEKKKGKKSDVTELNWNWKKRNWKKTSKHEQKSENYVADERTSLSVPKVL